VASQDELLNCELLSLIRTGVARGVIDQQEVREIETKLKMRGITDKVEQLIGTNSMKSKQRGGGLRHVLFETAVRAEQIAGRIDRSGQPRFNSRSTPMIGQFC